MAEPMTKKTFMDSFKGISSFKDEDREGYSVVYENGYVSWSPKGVFERCYREISDEEKALV